MLAKFAERFTTRAGEIHIDAPVLAFTMALSLLTGVLFGLVPAFSTGTNAGEALKQGGRNTSSRGRQILRGGLVVAQVAVSFMLLIGAGLMMRSFLKLEQQNPGFSPEHVLAMRLSMSHYSAEQLLSFSDRVLRRVGEVTGVSSAAFTSNFPFNPGGIAAGPNNLFFQIEGRAVAKGELAPEVAVNGASPEYFQTIGQPLVDGPRVYRSRRPEERAGGDYPNESLARHRWPGEEPALGQHEVTVGRRQDVDPDCRRGRRRSKEYGLDQPVRDEAYGAMKQSGFSNNLVVRTAGDPLAMTAALRAAIREIDSQVAIDRVNSIDRFRYESMASPRVMTILLGLFAGLAVLISAFGIAAVMALAVSQRTNELGIRMALGASRVSIVSMMVRHGLGLAVAGTAVGLAGALALTRLLSSLLYATSPTDAGTFLGVAALFLSIAAVASFVPARQVTAIDPLEALRRE